MPPIRIGVYILEAFNDLGRVSSGMSLIPLTWAEIEAFAQATGAVTTPLEKRLLRSMSVEYLDGLELGKDALAIAPWMPR